MRKNLLFLFFPAFSFSSIAQSGWSVCNTPVATGRIDDLFMVDQQTGYAVFGTGNVVKTVDGGNNWTYVTGTGGGYARSVEFINANKGFVGGFRTVGGPTNILSMTVNGGASWTDLTPTLHPKARAGICGLSIPDANTIYGGGNWFQDSAYLIKSTDGGTTWSFIDMKMHAASIIDMHFINKDTGFVAGTGPAPIRAAVILYTTDGGVTWDTKYYSSLDGDAYCWKIQRLTKMTWIASIQHFSPQPAKIIRSDDGGMNWRRFEVTSSVYNIQGAGFLTPLLGWAGGATGKSFETRDGGVTWDSIPVCPLMNRVVRLNDSTMLASGSQIWKYTGKPGNYPAVAPEKYASLQCRPNPVKGMLHIEASITKATRVAITIHDQNGRRLREIENADRPGGNYQYYFDTDALPMGVYYVVLRTHEDQVAEKIIVRR